MRARHGALHLSVCKSRIADRSAITLWRTSSVLRFYWSSGKTWLHGSEDPAVLRRYGRLKWLRDSGLIGVNRTLVNIVSFLRIAPNGLRDVHEMLVNVSLSLVQGGESGVFSPMHLLIFRKPE